MAEVVAQIRVIAPKDREGGGAVVEAVPIENRLEVTDHLDRRSGVVTDMLASQVLGVGDQSGAAPGIIGVLVDVDARLTIAVTLLHHQ